MEASVVHVTLSIKGIPGASAKSNEVVKAVENVYKQECPVLRVAILWRMRGLSSLPVQE